MPGLLRRDPAGLLKTAQPSGVIPGHDIAAGQVAIVMPPSDRRHRRPQAEQDRYANQLARCLKALGTGAPIRAHVQCDWPRYAPKQDTRSRSGEQTSDEPPRDRGTMMLRTRVTAR